MIQVKDNHFYLTTKSSSYIMRVLDNGILSNAYYGKKVGTYDMTPFTIIRGLPYGPSTFVDEGRKVCQETIPYEMPTIGRGSFGVPALVVEGKDNRFVNDPIYDSYEIINGKPKITGMPSFDKNVEDVQTLKITLRDEASGYLVNLYYSVFEEEDVIARHSEIVNICDVAISLKTALSAAVGFFTKDFNMTSLKGSHGRERHIETYPLHQGMSTIESRRGNSSHQLNPFIALSDKNADEDRGDVYGFALAYSGDFKFAVEKNEIDNIRVVAGINPETFDWELNPGESFETPECVLTYSDEGFNKMSQHFHDVCRNHLGKCADKDHKHPIVINNWEATYFNFDEAKIVKFIQDCKGLGIDTMVLDDGWFGHRDNDCSSLGDWFVYKEKLPNGLGKIIDTCKAQGMKFGIWFEPEMISEDSELFRAHPDWAIRTPDRDPIRCRQQLVLDLSRQEVVDYLFEKISAILSEYDISYVKWDMNRNITDNGADYLGKRQGEHSHRYILGVYALMERLTKAHPNVFFEGCAGGGGRFDFGILYYMPQIWTSDDSDPIERLKIQYGTSLVYPPSAIVGHVSAAPNHQTKRNTPFKTRGDVAQMCNFGYELNIAELSQEEIDEIPGQVAEHKGLEPLIQNGTYYRLLNPFMRRQCAWELVSDNQEMAYVMLATARTMENDKPYYLPVKGLNPDYLYVINDIEGKDIVADGKTIMNVGIPVMNPPGEYTTRIYYIKKK